MQAKLRAKSAEDVRASETAESDCGRAINRGKTICLFLIVRKCEAKSNMGKQCLRLRRTLSNMEANKYPATSHPF
jgi:hypothetical protein